MFDINLVFWLLAGAIGGGLTYYFFDIFEKEDKDKELEKKIHEIYEAIDWIRDDIQEIRLTLIKTSWVKHD